MRNKYKFLAFDVDNTITNSCTQITNDMADVLNKLKERLIFISGTHAPELKRMVSSKLNREHHILGNTGTHHILISPEKEKEIRNRVLEKGEREEIISALKKLKKHHNLASLTTEEDQIQDRGSQITFSILGRSAPKKEKESYDQNKKKRREFVSFLRKILGDKKYEIAIGGTTSIDITKEGNEKGVALEEFIKTQSISKDDILFFGDQLNPDGNDYSVIKTEIKCIAVKNPEETLKILKTLL